MDNRFADKFYKNPSVPHVKATVLAKGSLSCKERCKTQRVLALHIWPCYEKNCDLQQSNALDRKKI